MDENLARVIATQDVVFLGRRTYDEWADFWPNSEIEPFASFINGVEKYGVTSSVPEVAWAYTTTVDGGFLDLLARLKQGSGGDIGVHGSIALTQSATSEFTGASHSPSQRHRSSREHRTHPVPARERATRRVATGRGGGAAGEGSQALRRRDTEATDTGEERHLVIGIPAS